jgi:tetratricopeptide (TPR) repeat protein
MLHPLKLSLERISRAKSDSDTTLFFELLYLGEFVLKLLAAGLIAGVEDDRDSHRYRLMHRLIRSDGIGDWTQALDDVLNGPASQVLVTQAKDDRRAITERVAKDSWQHQAVIDLLTAAQRFGIYSDLNREKIALRSWFDLFPQLRNKTRGHGAPKLGDCAAAVEPFERSIRAIIDNLPSFAREWAFLRQNLSGKYNVVSISDSTASFNHLSKSRHTDGDASYREGIYIYYDRPRFVALLQTDIDLSDYFVPNGAFSGTRYELHSPLTDSKKLVDAAEFLAPAADRPSSETAGRGFLNPIGNVWANLPPSPEDYVGRPGFEASVLSLLTNDRHPVVTLVGRGGIGKTSLALTVLHQLARSSRFGTIIWFSARDIDLTQVGPKLAKPDVLTEADIAEQFVDLLEPKERQEKGFRAIPFISNNMARSSLGDPILFVFDNFETMRSPIDVFNWVDANIRLPNKALITSRFRDFKADYPVEIRGMGRGEVDALITNTSKRLGSSELFTTLVRDAIFEQSDGHPYVVKIIVGEITDAGKPIKPERVIASKEDILQALFERTFNNLSQMARRVFLTLCGWRSYIPQVAIEAVVFRNQQETPDTSAGIDELDRMSLIQRRKGADGEDFLGVPLAAAIFGQKKLATSPLRTAIELDVRFLQELGPTNATSIGHGVVPRIRRLGQSLASKVADGKMEFNDARVLLEFIASRIPDAWVLLADLANEVLAQNPEVEREYLRRYIEAKPENSQLVSAWERLASSYRASGDVLAASRAYIEAFQLEESPYEQISSVANWLNNQRNALGAFDLSERRAVFLPLATLMEARIGRASATDLSRLAWLYLHTGNLIRCADIAHQGLAMDPSNLHCQRLIERLKEQT